MYAWMSALTQRSEHAVISAGAGASLARLGGAGRRRRRTGPCVPPRSAPPTSRRSPRSTPPGSARCDRNLSGPALRRGYLRGIGEVVARLGIGARHVIWGHSHRAGPWPADDAAEWVAPGGARIVNSGSWVYERHFLSDSPNDSPYWPGVAVVRRRRRPPRLVRLLGERGHRELAPPA